MGSKALVLIFAIFWSMENGLHGSGGNLHEPRKTTSEPLNFPHDMQALRDLISSHF